MSAAAAPTRYTVRFPAPAEHLAAIEATYAAPPAGGDLEVMMAVWTPGSYLVREYARHVRQVAARGADGRALPIEKVKKNRWRIAAGGGPVTLSYKLHCRELSVRTNFVDAGFALLNGAATFLVPAAPDGPAAGGFEVAIELPGGWREVVTPLPPADGDPDGHRFAAADFETLVDSPIYAGNGRLYRFEVAGVPHVLADEGSGGPWDGERAAAALERLVPAHLALWGELPYPRFAFVNLVVEATGGLEHRDGAVLMTSRWKAGTRKGWLEWLGLASHELFHAWNGKRLRPVELGPFDYEREVYTRGLWAVEGITSYYDDLLVHRAGLARRDELLERLSDQIERLETTPGRRLQSLEAASFDAWIKHYRPDAETINSAVSYYVKGAVVSFLLDVAIRRATGDERSLDDVLRRAWGRWAGERGFTGEELVATVAEVAGSAVAERLEGMLATTDDLDYGEALDWLGLRFTAKPSPPDAPAEPAGWLGAETEVDDGRLVVRRVLADTPARRAGLTVDDEILALDGFRVPPRSFQERLRSFPPGSEATLTVARRERLIELPVRFVPEPKLEWRLAVDPAAGAEQRARLASWLAGRRPVELSGVAEGVPSPDRGEAS